MSEQNFSFPIPNNVLEPYIKSAVSTAIVAALGDGTSLIEKAVHQALTHKVNSQGKVDSYSSYNTHNLVDIVARDAIIEITKSTINEMAEQMRPKIREQIEKQLKTQHSKLAQAMVDGMIEGLKSSWSVKVDINTTER